MTEPKQNWEITGKDLGDDRVITTFTGTRRQAEAYHELMYDTTATKLQPLTIMDLDKIEFEGDEILIEAKHEGSLLFSFGKDEDKYWIWDEDTEEYLKHEGEVDLEKMELFAGFREATTCQTCEGKLYYPIVDCSKPASACCGGCEKMVPCDCENIKIRLED